MTTPATIWREAMAERAAKRAAALADGKTSPAHAARDAALCALFTQHCVTSRPDADRIMALPVDTVQDLHDACQIAEGIAKAAFRIASTGHRLQNRPVDRRHPLYFIARDGRIAINIVRARIAAAHQVMGESAPAWCRAA